MNDALELIANERTRQIDKGYDAAHDDEHDSGEIAHIAAYYLCIDNLPPKPGIQAHQLYPHLIRRPPLKNHLDHAIRGAACAIAEVERLIRLGLEQVPPATDATGTGTDQDGDD